MSRQIRLDPNLVNSATTEAALSKRSVPKQIEFWADIGRILSREITLSDMLAISQGLKRIVVVDPDVPYIPLESIQEEMSTPKNYHYGHINSKYAYGICEDDKNHLTQRTMETGETKTGTWEEGTFVE